MSDQIKHFILNNLAIRADLRDVEDKWSIQALRPSHAIRKDRYYPQFSDQLRREAEQMSDHYKIFYCLENFLREMIIAKLLDEHGEDWWNLAVPDQVKKNAGDSRKKEITSGNTPRSDLLIDYTTFGELSEIIKSNWVVFGDVFRDIRAIETILGRLNTLRGPIAHCKLLAEDEVVRLDLSMRDLFRQMGAPQN